MQRRLQRAHSDHCGIVDAILDRNPETAARLAHEHVATVQAELQKASGFRR
ncbi:FCD domain-containing protein [Streptomyces sp. NPDC057694]|uniref:FCD domain-containing protein n=1 Tax=Streptomyces sp. NPDC057694 TaxID=3346216 RepID=UPI0036BE4937